MKKQLCAALLAGSMLTTSMVFAGPLDYQPLLDTVMPISAPVVINEVARLTIGSTMAIINNQEVQLPFAPYLKQGVTLVPLELLAQFLNTRPTYNPQDDTVTLQHHGYTISFRLGEDTARDGQEKLKQLPAPTEAIEGRTAIPLRAFAELLGITVHYEDGAITLVRPAHQDYQVGFQSLDAKLLPAFDYSQTPKVYVGYAKDYLTDYAEGEGDSLILAISQPGQEMMIQNILVKEDRVIVGVIPENRWSNAPEGAMGLVHYGARRVVKLLDPLPQGLPLMIDGYELPAKAAVEAEEVVYTDFADRLELNNDQLKDTNAFSQRVTTDGKEQLVLVAALGERQTGGYAIEILWIEKAEGKLIVHAKEKTPDPDSMVIMAITYPYEAVVIDSSYEGWDIELNLVQTVDFTHADWVPVNGYEEAEPGVVKTMAADGQLLLTACAGAKPNPGYSLMVERVELEGQRLIVHARITEPAPETIWPQVIAYPRDVVAVDASYADCTVQLVLH